MMSQTLKAALIDAEDYLRKQSVLHDFYSRRKLAVKDELTRINSEADLARVQCNEARRLMGQGYLRLMNSGISHRAFLKFVREASC